MARLPASKGSIDVSMKEHKTLGLNLTQTKGLALLEQAVIMEGFWWDFKSKAIELFLPTLLWRGIPQLCCLEGESSLSIFDNAKSDNSL